MKDPTPYPRPQMVRDNWMSLCGEWEYAITRDEKVPEHFDGKITVPFSPESPLSGVGRTLQPGEVLWYRRFVEMPKADDGRVHLHFEAVDQRMKLWVNNRFVGEGIGGYWPISFDITSFIQDGSTCLLVAVQDDSDQSQQAYGKQKLQHGGIWYQPQSGIWQPVWIERLPMAHILAYRVTPDISHGSVTIEAEVSQAVPVSVDIYANDEPVAGARAENHGTHATVKLDIPGMHLWDTEDPFLYTLRIRACEDVVTGYFGMRSFSLVRDAKGTMRVALNGKPLFLSGLLDQGYFGRGLYTPIDDDMMKNEITKLRSLGFNMLRKHIKIEPRRWYYHCDCLGMLIWQDFVCGGDSPSAMVSQYLPFAGIHLNDHHYRLFGRKSDIGRSVFQRDMVRTVSHLYNCVSIMTWVIFNEGWGQFDSRIVERNLRELDTTRLVDSVSGWHDQGGGDFLSRHVYFVPYRFHKDWYGRAVILSEFGGYSLAVLGHLHSEKRFGYKMLPDKTSLEKAYTKLIRRDILPNIKKGLCGCIYTQVSDVEEEINGLFTADRAVLKMEEDLLLSLNRQLQNEMKRCLETEKESNG